MVSDIVWYDSSNVRKTFKNSERMSSRLSEDEIFLFALGNYHIKLAKSHCAEHLRDGVYYIELYRDSSLSDLPKFNILQSNVWLVRVRVQSRHVRSRIYYSYILINQDLANRHAIAYWYCTCLIGNFTVGSCAHIQISLFG